MQPENWLHFLMLCAGKDCMTCLTKTLPVIGIETLMYEPVLGVSLFNLFQC